MQHLTADLIAYTISVSANICYVLLFLYNAMKKDTNYSLLMLSGSLCLAMAFALYLTSYRGALDKSSTEYYALAVNNYLIWVILDSFFVMTVFVSHRILNVPFHHAVKYVYRCIFVSIVLNIAMHIDIIVLGNRDTQWLYSTYDYTQNFVTIFMFASVLVARKWSEIFKSLPLALSR
jgi:hypothetical protein